MGHKIHPRSHRLGIIESWRSRWYSKKEIFRKFLEQDVLLRNFINKKLADARVEKIEIERPGQGKEVIVNIYTAKPGMVIGRGGGGIDDLRKEIEQKLLRSQTSIKLNIHDVKQSSGAAAVVAQNIAADLVKRMPFRRAVKQALDQIQKGGAKGAKIQVAGRLNGAEIARTETLSYGSMPLHTLRANIDYFNASAFTTYGVVGVSVWVYKGEVFEKDESGEKGADVLKELKKITDKGKRSAGKAK